MLLTRLQLIDRLATLVPPRRVHRHRYYGVLAANLPPRPAVAAPMEHVTGATALTRLAVCFPETAKTPVGRLRSVVDLKTYKTLARVSANLKCHGRESVRWT